MALYSYAELGTAYPNTYPNVGGTYHHLKRAFGADLAFLFAWARMTVIQTGLIALLAFIFGDLRPDQSGWIPIILLSYGG